MPANAVGGGQQAHQGERAIKIKLLLLERAAALPGSGTRPRHGARHADAAAAIAPRRCRRPASAGFGQRLVSTRAVTGEFLLTAPLLCRKLGRDSRRRITMRIVSMLSLLAVASAAHAGASAASVPELSAGGTLDGLVLLLGMAVLLSGKRR
jgi:hypothetical protein